MSTRRHAASRYGGHPTPAYQTGQSLAEIVVLSIVLIPLFLLTPILGKYIHGKQRVQQATHELLWEATVAPDYNTGEIDANLENHRQHVINRHFGHAGTPITSELPDQAPEEDQQLDNPLFNTFSNQPLALREDVALYFNREQRPETGTTAADLAVDAARLASSASCITILANCSGDRRAQAGSRMNTAEVELHVQNLRTRDGQPALYLEPFEALDLSFTSRQAMLTDTWAARGSGMRGPTGNGHQHSVLNQTQAWAPSFNGVYKPSMLDVPNLLSFFPRNDAIIQRFVKDPKQNSMDLVPPDRLDTWSETPP